MYTRVSKGSKMESQGKDFAVYYAQDGKPLADYIKEKFSDTRFDCSVEIFDIKEVCKNLRNDTESSTLPRSNVKTLIVSPSFLSYANSSETIPYDVIFPLPEKTVALFFYVDISEAHKLVNGLCDRASKWTRKDTGNNQESLRECLVTLITLLEEDSVAPLPVLKTFSLMPSTVTSNDDKIYVMFTQETRGKVEVQQEDDRLEAVFCNPYTYVFSPQGHFSGESEVQVFVNGSPAGKETLLYLSDTEELERLLRNVNKPLDLLCTAVTGEGSCSVGMLDQTLDHMFCNPSCTVSSNLHAVSIDADQAREQEYPTLLHLAARYGLKNLCGSMLDTPGGKLAVCIRNRDGLTPVDIAVKYEHQALMKYLRDTAATRTELQDFQEGKREAYCDMTLDRDMKMREVIPERSCHYDFIDERSAHEDVQRSVSSPATMDSHSDIYMDMEALMDPKVLRPKKGSRKKTTKPPVPDVTRRPRNRTVESGVSRESARISMIRVEEIAVLPRPPRREERIYTSIKEITDNKKKTTQSDIVNFRKS